MENSDNPFEFHESDLYVACVGDNGGTDNFDIREGFKSSVDIMIKAVENGAYEDTMIYPVVYNVRHSIECQTAHCGRCKPHLIFGEFISPIVPYRNSPQAIYGMTADCRSFV